MRANHSSRRTIQASRRRGAGLVIALVTLLIVTSTMAAIIQSLVGDLRQTRQTAGELQAQWLADSAISRAGAQLQSNASYTGEIWRAAIGANDDANSAGVAEIRIERAGDAGTELRVTVEARYPDHEWRRVVARRTLSISIPNKKPASGASPQENAP